MRLFISYRRNDSPDVAGRIHDRLVEKFADENVYYDVDSIPFGVDFRDHIESMMRASDVLLVVIGPRWFQAEDGRRQIEDPSDFVRVEVEAGLHRNIRVVPTLVKGARVPSPHDLPESIRALAFRNGLQVRQDPDFHGDMTRLINSLTTPVLVVASFVVWLTAINAGSGPAGGQGVAASKDKVVTVDVKANQTFSNVMSHVWEWVQGIPLLMTGLAGIGTAVGWVIVAGKKTRRKLAHRNRTVQPENNSEPELDGSRQGYM